MTGRAPGVADDPTQMADGSHMGHTDHAPPLCQACGQPIGGAVSWMLPGGYPKREHEACVDWTKRTFPFTRQLAVLRQLGVTE